MLIRSILNSNKKMGYSSRVIVVKNLLCVIFPLNCLQDDMVKHLEMRRNQNCTDLLGACRSLWSKFAVYKKILCRICRSWPVCIYICVLVKLFLRESKWRKNTNDTQSQCKIVSVSWIGHLDVNHHIFTVRRTWVVFPQGNEGTCQLSEYKSLVKTAHICFTMR